MPLPKPPSRLRLIIMKLLELVMRRKGSPKYPRARFFDSMRCFARRHMAPAIAAFHDYARRVSEKSGIFYSDARRDAAEFGESGVSKNTINGWIHWLESSGWFKRIDRGKRLKRNPLTGSYESIRYEVLGHDEWAKDHPGQCRFPSYESLSQKLGPAEESPVPIADSPVPETGTGLSQFLDSPVPETGTKQEKKARDTSRQEKKQESKSDTGDAPTDPKTGSVAASERFRKIPSRKDQEPQPIPTIGELLNIAVDEIYIRNSGWDDYYSLDDVDGPKSASTITGWIIERHRNRKTGNQVVHQRGYFRSAIRQFLLDNEAGAVAGKLDRFTDFAERHGFQWNPETQQYIWGALNAADLKELERMDREAQVQAFRIPCAVPGCRIHHRTEGGAWNHKVDYDYEQSRRPVCRCGKKHYSDAVRMRCEARLKSQ
jgi:hypothetical protein